MLSFTGDIRAYCAYTKRIDFLFLSEVFWKPKASGVSLGSSGKGYELNILENGRRGGLFGGAHSPLPLLIKLSFTGDIRLYCAYTKRIDFLFFWRFFWKPKAYGVTLEGCPIYMNWYDWYWVMVFFARPVRLVLFIRVVKQWLTSRTVGELHIY